MTPVRIALRWLGRLTIVAVAGIFISVVGLQYTRIIGKNVSLAGRLSAAQSDIVTLRAKQTEQDLQIRRLSDPAGAIPEIHDKLHLVRDHETIIYLQRHGDGR